MGTMMVSQAMALTPDFHKALSSSTRIFNLLDRKPLMDSTGQSGLRLNSIGGNIELNEAEFSYPLRRQSLVLRRLTLHVEAGQKVALVGASGCGKSTCIQLLQRFYDLKAGEILMEGENVEKLNVALIRSKLGIVSQEPVLFDRTLADNIRYGDNSRNDISMEDVIEAAKKANIHTFISTLPSVSVQSGAERSVLRSFI